MSKRNPILLSKVEIELNLRAIEALCTKHLRAIQKDLPDNYTSLTLICRTNRPSQQIVLSNKMNVKEDIKALKTMIVDAPSSSTTVRRQE